MQGVLPTILPFQGFRVSKVDGQVFQGYFFPIQIGMDLSEGHYKLVLKMFVGSKSGYQ